MIRVLTPATSANLGPGFDLFGLALELYNEVRFIPDDEWRVTAEGYGAEYLSGHTDLLVCQAIRRIYSETGRGCSGGQVHLVNKIPDVGGLGTSASAIVGGLVAANCSLGEPLTKDELLQLAMELEGHPDNVAPAIYGGLVAVYLDDSAKVSCLRIPFPEEIQIVLVIPRLKISTEEARRLLPEKIPLQDAVFNISRAGLLIGACFSNRPDLLEVAMRDKIHQPYRAQLIPGFNAVLENALRAGAYGAALSGSGPTIIALAPSAIISKVGSSMVEALEQSGVTAEWMSLPVNTDGYRIISQNN